MSDTTGYAGKPTPCPHCGTAHSTTCPRIRAIECHANGTTKRIEFHEPMPVRLAIEDWRG